MQYIVLKNYINILNILYMADIQLLQSCTTGGDVYLRLHPSLYTHPDK